MGSRVEALGVTKVGIGFAIGSAGVAGVVVTVRTTGWATGAATTGAAGVGCAGTTGAGAATTGATGVATGALGCIEL